MEPRWLNFPLFSRREPVTLALLTGMAIVLFVAVSGLSRLYQAQQESLAERWAARGTDDLQARKFDAAVNDFRAALLYSRDSNSNQLNLAEALLGLGRTDEAYAYLITLWDHEPENGVVNLDLARIAASRSETTRALRFYHNAIYATWPGDQATASRNTRLELIEYLLRIHAQTQAQAELLALAANLSEKAPEQERLGSLFLSAQDPQHALAAFQYALAQNRHNQAALAGAGIAAFRLGFYPTAKRYLQEAISISPNDAQSTQWLHKTDAVLALDPYRRHISDADRNRIAANAFNVAGARLKACASQPGLQDFQQQWDKLKPQITLRSLRQNPDLVSAAMDLAINVESNTRGTCGSPSESDAALLLIANLHEEN